MKWNCKYGIVFALKYRGNVFYGKRTWEIGEILRTRCEWRGIKLIGAEECPDYIYMLVEISLKVTVSSFTGYLKGTSSLLRHKLPEPGIPERWVLYGGSRKECEKDRGVHQAPTG